MPQSQAPGPDARLRTPLTVDLDGTLICTDLLWETFVQVLRRQPLALLAAPGWWLRGRARLKQELGQRAGLMDPARLPVHEEFLVWLRAEKQSGRKLVLATASDAAAARPVMEYFRLFDDFIGSDGQRNLRGDAKGLELAMRYGEGAYDYCGNSSVDLAVWAHARCAIVVNASPGLVTRAARVTKIERVFPPPRPPGNPWLQTLLPAVQPADLLVLVALALEQSLRPAALGWLGLILLAFLLASLGTGLLRQLLDLDEVRLAEPARQTPLARGELRLSVALSVMPLAWLAGLALARAVGAGAAWLVLAALALEILRLYALRGVVWGNAAARALGWALRLGAGLWVLAHH